jgi:hypothetical protein
MGSQNPVAVVPPIRSCEIWAGISDRPDQSYGRLSIAALTAAFALTCAVASAQTTLKFGAIDMQKALLSTKDGEKAVAEMKAKFAPKQQEFEKRQAELGARQEQNRETENTISEEAKVGLPGRYRPALVRSRRQDHARLVDTRRCADSHGV